jgi:dinuclear metal center YbgI/SA1388 family protein
MKIKDLLNNLESSFPGFLQESYDNTGDQVVFPDEDITGIYICLDPDRFVIEDALASGSNLIISHHPLIFKPVKSIVQGDVRSESLIKLISSKITLYALHTNFDKIMYDYLARFLGFEQTEPLFETDTFEEKPVGLGSVAFLDNEVELFTLLEIVKKKLELDFILYSGGINSLIKSIAFVNGSGGSSIEKIIKRINPDCIITGDVGYHHMKFVIENNKSVIDAGHFGTEKIFKSLMCSIVDGYIKKSGEEIKVIESEVEKNPFKVY